MKPHKKNALAIALALAAVLALGVCAVIAATNDSASSDTLASSSSSNVVASPVASASGQTARTETTIKLAIGKPTITVNGQQSPIDEDDTVPVIQEGRTLMPIRAVVEAMGGTVSWEQTNQTATLVCGGQTIQLAIGQTTAYLGNEAKALDVAPVIINGRTMLPILFVAESFGYAASWNGDAQEVTITNMGTDANDAVAVYMVTAITPDGLQAVYEALGIAPDADDKVAVKVSTGEPPASNYLRQELIGELVKGLNGTYIECNTAYGGQRAATAMHYQVAKDHGFDPIVLIDDCGTKEIPISGGAVLTKDIVGDRIDDFNFHIVLSHFKGHAMAGYGGALKNLSIGYASSSGKNLIHSGGASESSFRGDGQDAFLKAMADAATGVVRYVNSLEGGQMIYINVMNRLSIDCDCNGNPSEPDIHDIGILASADPVALDQACIDLIYKAEGNESFVRRVERQNGVLTIESAEAIGLGTRKYTLVSLDNRTAESANTAINFDV
ncbi:MAG: DUF362 domain-containing protein [Clostridiales bacterium]|jgi:uncharacterized Fe-S center protein|nr:DUF362 domain-containing protein [Clostridiales bacterium]